MADSVIARDAPMSHEWHYENGVMLKAMEGVWKKTGDAKYYQSIRDTLEQFIEPDGNIRRYRLAEYNLDQINLGKALFPVWRATQDERYRRAAVLLREQLQWQPRTREGGFWHKLIYPYQMWLDGIYMGTAFLAEFADVFNEAAAFDEVAFQIIALEKHTRDPKTGLLYHAWDESRKQRWANSETGCSPHFWGRAIGWYMMAIVDTLDHFPREHPERHNLMAILQRAAEAIANVQDASTGVWHQVLDQLSPPPCAGEGRVGAVNYREASASCMLAFALAKGVRQGVLDQKYFKIAQRAYEGILENFVQVDAKGLVNLNWTCGSAGLGGTPYRDGSFEYYVGERIVTNDYKGMGPFIMVSVEIEK